MKHAAPILIALLAIGCASNKPAMVNAPSSTPVREQIHAASAATQQAATSIKAAGQSNAEVRTALDRIDSKLQLIDRWQETHKNR